MTVKPISRSFAARLATGVLLAAYGLGAAAQVWSSHPQAALSPKEAKVRFSEIRPQTIGQAGRIPGITPADVALLTIWLEKRDRSGSGAV